LFGETGYERELHMLVARLELTDRVEFTGHIDDVAGQLDRADVLVHASVIPEPFGLVVVEAMAAGVPVIAADAGGPAEVITNGVDGLLTAPGDVDALAEALQALAMDEPLRQRLSTNAHARARDFGPDRVGPSITDLYRTVVGTRRIAPSRRVSGDAAIRASVRG